MRRDTPQRYGTVSRLLHWLMAILVLWQALKLFDRIDDGEHWIGQTLVPWHLSIGSLLLLLIVLRIIWALRNVRHRPPAPPPPQLGFLANSRQAASIAWRHRQVRAMLLLGGARIGGFLGMLAVVAIALTAINMFGGFAVTVYLADGSEIVRHAVFAAGVGIDADVVFEADGNPLGTLPVHIEILDSPAHILTPKK